MIHSTRLKFVCGLCRKLEDNHIQKKKVRMSGLGFFQNPENRILGHLGEFLGPDPSRIFSQIGLPYFSYFVTFWLHVKNQKKMLSHFSDLALQTDREQTLEEWTEGWKSRVKFIVTFTSTSTSTFCCFTGSYGSLSKAQFCRYKPY